MMPDFQMGRCKENCCSGNQNESGYDEYDSGSEPDLIDQGNQGCVVLTDRCLTMTWRLNASARRRAELDPPQSRVGRVPGTSTAQPLFHGDEDTHRGIPELAV